VSLARDRDAVMRILVISHLYPPHHLGGYEIACRGVVERMVDRGHEVIVLTSDTRLDGVDESSMPSRAEVRRTLRMWWDWDSFSPTSPPLRSRFMIERHNQHALRDALGSLRPEVASIWSLGFVSWSLPTILERRSVPVVLTMLDQWICTTPDFDAWTRLFTNRRWARPIGSVLGLETRLPTFTTARASAASHMIADEIGRDGRWSLSEIAVVPLGVDTDDFPITAAVARGWSWRLLYVGRVVASKGVPTLIRALTELPTETTLAVVGHAHDNQRREMTELAEQCGVADRVSFSRAVSRADLRERYRRADLVVFPSEWPEPFGIVPLEAMACGVPVIATGTGGSGEFLEDGTNCVLFRPGDPQDLVAAARRVADDPGLRHAITAGGTRTARTFTMERFGDELERIHLEAARPPG
jgi:glycosyltransferase involved in cell wall biosynthesis